MLTLRIWPILVASTLLTFALDARAADAPKQSAPPRDTNILVEAESFQQLGGWSVDQQYMDLMGSPVLLAHGLGKPVQDATTTVNFPASGTYRVWVRTRDWVAPWNAPGAPGRFQLIVNGKPLDTTFGTEGAQWHWQDGGTLEVHDRQVRLALHDLTGFDGRCDAIVFTAGSGTAPANTDPDMAAFRRRALRLPDRPEEAGPLDFVVVGGGMAGTCAAISAARLGLNVALIQDRPVLGGNNSSEIRVGLSGKVQQEPYPALGDVVRELAPIDRVDLLEAQKHPDRPESQKLLKLFEREPLKTLHNAGPASNYEDQKKLRIAQAEPNLHLFLNMHAIRVEKRDNRIVSVTAKDVRSGREKRFAASLFADCTGDGTIGYLAGADYRVGRECRSETGESMAPEKPDQLVMGTSVQWYAVEEKGEVAFPDCPWALPFNDQSCQRATRGDWDWETGLNRDQVADFEQIRDHALRAAFGNWAFLKNHARDKAKYANWRLAWMAYIGGKRESRRLMGDVVLRQQDIQERRSWPDACVTATWPIDLHYPAPENTKHFPGQEFRSIAPSVPIKPYPIPYRCLYSRNVENLLMAGRNISVTHVALGAVRVQKTTGMMGEVIGMAASLCKAHGTDPRGVYENYLEELKPLMRRGVGKQVAPTTENK